MDFQENNGIVHALVETSGQRGRGGIAEAALEGDTPNVKHSPNRNAEREHITTDRAEGN